MWSNDEMQEITWDEFREKKLLWWVNMLLHTFGYVLVADFDDDGKIIEVFPATTTNRGFTENINTAGYEGMTKLMEAMKNEDN